ncbi:hypothetical protein Hanom_Chr17g01560411 [Helianthus anomalus]
MEGTCVTYVGIYGYLGLCFSFSDVSKLNRSEAYGTIKRCSLNKPNTLNSIPFRYSLLMESLRGYQTAP